MPATTEMCDEFSGMTREEVEEEKEKIMQNELAVTAAVQHSDKLTDVQRLGKLLAASNYFKDVSEVAQAAVKVMAGEELGIAPVASMMGINIIKGKVALSANLIASLVRRHGYNYKHIEFDNKGCNLEFVGKNGEHLGYSSFNEADAKNAGVFSDMYQKYPRNMYYSRAMSNGAKWFCPEVLSGLPVYVPEELGATVDGDGEIVHASPSVAAKAVGERKLVEMSQPKAVFEATDDDIPKEMGGAWQEPKLDPAKPWKTMKQFLDLMAGLKAFMGDDAYYEVLHQFGLEHANEAKSTEIAVKIYAELKRIETLIRTEDVA